MDYSYQPYQYHPISATHHLSWNWELRLLCDSQSQLGEPTRKTHARSFCDHNLPSHRIKKYPQVFLVQKY